MKRTPLKRTPPRRIPHLSTFWEQVTDGGTRRCVLADFQPHGLGVECAGPLDAHHLVAKQHLVDRQATDVRNGVPVCRFHHQQLEARRIYLHPDDLPEGFDRFLDDIGQPWRLPYILGSRRANG